MDESFMRSHGFFAVAIPSFLPGGRSVLFTSAASLIMEDFQIAVLSLESGEVKFLMEEALCYGYVSTGHLLYGQEGAIMAAPFDADTLEVSGPSVPVTEVEMELHPQFHIPMLFALSTKGLLIYAPGSEHPASPSVVRDLVWADREGNEERLAAPQRLYRSVDLSPDGNNVAVLLSDQPDIWLLDLTRKPITQQRLTFDFQLPTSLVWTPDSQRLVFSILQDGAWSLAWKAANGTGPVEILYTSENEVYPSSCSPDGKLLIFEDWPSPSNGDIWALSLEGEPDAHPLMAEKYYEGASALSPDGRWMAYGSNESGEYNVYVRPFPNLDDGKWMISTQGGGWPIWAPGGRELHYVRAGDQDQVMVVTFETEPAIRSG